MAVLLGGQPVDDFVERAIATASDHQLTAFNGRLLRHLRGVARSTRFDELGFDSAAGEDATSLVKHLTTASAAVAGVRIVDQQSIS